MKYGYVAKRRHWIAQVFAVRDNAPEQWKEYQALHAEMAPLCPRIFEKKAPLQKSSNT